MVPERPPLNSPPVVLTAVYAESEPGPRGPSGGVEDGRLIIRSSTAEEPAGIPVADVSFRDVLVDCRLELLEGGDDSVYGVYVRQTQGARYIGWGMTPTGRALAGAIDQTWQPYVDADLAPDMPFERGLGHVNRFQVLTFGPAIVFVLNGAVVTGITVDARFKEGFVGLWLLQGRQAPRAVMAADWLQIRAVLPDQEPGPQDPGPQTA